jgi:hypothetical protein
MKKHIRNVLITTLILLSPTIWAANTQKAQNITIAKSGVTRFLMALQICKTGVYTINLTDPMLQMERVYYIKQSKDRNTCTVYHAAPGDVSKTNAYRTTFSSADLNKRVTDKLIKETQDGVITPPQFFAIAVFLSDTPDTMQCTKEGANMYSMLSAGKEPDCNFVPLKKSPLE